MTDYDSIIAQDTPASSDPYDAIVQQEVQSQRALVATRLATTQAPPDKAAADLAVAKRMGVPLTVVSAFPDDFKRRVALEDNAAALAKAPVLAGTLAAKPQAVDVMHDDVGNASAIEQHVRATMGDYLLEPLKGLGGGYNSLAGSFNLLLGAVPTAADYVHGLFTGKTETGLQDAYFGRTVAPRLEAQDAFTPDPSTGFAGRALNAAGRLTGTLSQIILSAPTAEALPATATTGQVVGAGVEHGTKAMLVPALNSAIETARNVYQATGGDAMAAAKAAQAAYIVGTASGVVPMAAPGALPVRLLSGAVSGAIQGEAGRVAMNDALPAGMQQQFDPEELVLNALAGTVLSIHGAPDAQSNRAADAIRETYAKQARIDAAADTVSALQGLSQLAGASKWRARDPEGFHEFIRSVTDQPGTLAQVFVDPHVLAAELDRAGVNPDAFRQAMPSVADQLKVGLETNSDVSIPIADFAAHLAATPIGDALLQHLKSDPAGATFAEAKAFMQSERTDMGETAQKLATAKVADDGRAAAEKAVFTDVNRQIRDTTRFSPQVSKQYAALHSAFYSTLADRLGVSPLDVYAAHGARIVGSDMERQTGALEQPARGTYSPAGRVIGLSPSADLSTLLHESGHFFLDTYSRIAEDPTAPQSIRDDMGRLHDWFGMTGEQWLAENAKFRETGEISPALRAAHEKFAEGFEHYLREGQAPSQALQGMFQRFRAWLVSVYKNLSELRTEFNPEVRGVVDRMLASEESIRQAEAARGQFALFKDKPEGMTDEEWQAYRDLGAQATQDAIGEMQAKSIRDMQWLSNAKGRAVKDLEREAAGARQRIAAEVTAQVDEMPVYKAERWLRTGETTSETGEAIKATAGYKLNSDDLATMFPPGELARPDLSKLAGLTSKDGLHPDLVAEMFGFNSGRELVQALANREDKATVIEGMTDRRMLEEHGELSSPDAIDRAANAAVSNDARARFIATGLKVLAKSPVSARELARGAKEAAEAAIARRKVEDLNPRTFEIAEARANREAIKLAGSDPAGAVRAQRAALLNNRLVRATLDAMREVEDIRVWQKKFDRDTIRTKLDPDVLDQIDALRERFDFRKAQPSGPTKQEQQLQQWVDAQKALGYSPVEVAAMLDPSVRKPYQEMTVEEVRGFRDTIASLEQIARERKTIMVGDQARDIRDVADEMVDKLRTRPDQFTDEQLAERPRAGVDPLFKVAVDRVAAFFRGAASELKNPQTRANLFDRHEVLGPFRTILFDRVFDANYRKLDMLSELSKDFERMGREVLGVDWQKQLLDVVANHNLMDNSLPVPKKRRLTYGDLVAIALHTGNESNFDKLVRGMGWRPAEVMRTLELNLGEKHWTAVQHLWDSFEKFWPQMEAMNRALGNTSPAHIEPRPFKIQAADTGRYLDLRGGYAPVRYDPVRSKLAARKEGDTDGLFGRNYYRADTTTNGSLNARNQNYYDFLDLDFHTIERALHETIHDLAYRRALIDAHKLLTDPALRRQIMLSHGPEAHQDLLDWLSRTANAAAMDGNQSKFVRFMRWTRTAIVANGIAFRISTMEKHGGAALFKSFGYSTGGGNSYLAARMAAIGLDHAAQVKEALEKFPEIRARAMQQDRDFKQTIASLVSPESLHGKAERFGHAGVAFLDFLSAVPLAHAAYDRAIAEGIPKNRGGTGKPMTHEEAVHYANSVVREAHGSSIESARPNILNNPNELIKTFSTLYGFMNNTLNQMVDATSKAGTAGFSKPEVLARYLAAGIIPALWTGWLAGEFQDEPWWKAAGRSIAGEAAGMVPFLRDAYHAMEGYHSAGLPPWMSAMGAVAKPAHDLLDAAEGKEVPHPIKDAGNALGLAIPGLGQIGTSAQYLADYAQGKERPQSVGEFISGVAHGPKPKRKQK